jgi:hypothetical protein
MWTVVLTVGIICVAAKYFGADFNSAWLTKHGTELGVIAAVMLTALMVLIACKSAARAVRLQQTSAGKFFIYFLIGVVCSELAKGFSIIGIGCIFGVYGFIGLAIIGYKKLFQRKNLTSVNTSSEQKQVS